MSDRLYIPGVSAPMPFNQVARTYMLSKTGSGIRSGFRTPENPLGLYELMSQEMADGDEPSNTPKPYTAPYTLPDQEFLERNNLISESAKPYGAAAGLCFGGIVAYVQLCNPKRFSDTERANIHKTNMLMFSSYISFVLHQSIAEQVVEQFGQVPMATLTRVMNRSFLSTIGLLTRCSGDDALRIEESLGYASPDPERGAPIPAKLVVRTCEQKTRGRAIVSSPSHAEITVADEHMPADAVRCGGHYTNFAGMTLEEHLWRRTTRICVSLPWLFPELLGKYPGV
jgi:hypothetical protein